MSGALKIVATVANEAEAEMVCGRLSDAGIHAISQRTIGGPEWGWSGGRYVYVDEADAQLVGKAVVLTNGKAGTVEAVWLDEVHGLRISIEGHVGKWPVSTVKFAQS